MRFAIQHFSERVRVADGVAADVVVEINKGFEEARPPTLDAISPLTQLSLRIIPSVAGATAVKTNISEIGGQFSRPGHLSPVVDAKRDVVAAKQIKHFCRVPAFVAKFDRKFVASRKNGEEFT